MFVKQCKMILVFFFRCGSYSNFNGLYQIV